MVYGWAHLARACISHADRNQADIFSDSLSTTSGKRLLVTRSRSRWAAAFWSAQMRGSAFEQVGAVCDRAACAKSSGNVD